MRYACFVAALFAAASGSAIPAQATGISLSNAVMAQQRATAADGSTRVTLVPATRVTPGDRVVFKIAYRNGGATPAEKLVLANPIPAELAYRGPSAGSAAPEVSVDGRTYGPLATLKVHDGDGASRSAQPADVTHVRWQLGAPVAPGASGSVSFEAVVR